jgi:hypothetical protein
MPREWREIEPLLDFAAGLNGEALQAWLSEAPDELRQLLACDADFGRWAAEAAAQLLETPPRLRLPCMLGHYRVVRQLAEGGMGEVYEAEDPRLNRKVAIKVLRTGTAARLADEARALAGLRHPNICRIYDISRAEDVDYFVMELLDGVPLSDRLRKGPLPLHDALATGRAIASALAEAHRAGIVHRDFKPANIMLTRNGPSLVDFGIADWVTAGTAMPAGTPPYMAPEQAAGVCDPRSDIYSAGCVLREMAGPDAPSAVKSIIESCVREDPDERWQSAADLAKALEWIGDPIARPAPRRAWIGYVIAAVMVLAVAVMIAQRRDRPAPVVLVPVRARNGSIPNPQQLAISPDGTRVAFPAPGDAGEPLIWIRKLTEWTPQALASTVGAYFPFWSPDGRSIGLFRGRTLQTLDLTTGALRTLTEIPGVPQRAVWAADNHILYCVGGLRKQGVIYRINAVGGVSQRITELNGDQEEYDHRQPVLLPGGSHFLYLARSNLDVTAGSEPGSTYLATLGSAGRTLLLRRALPVGASGDRVFYLREGKLWSQRLNAPKGRWVDDPKLEVAGAAWADVTPSGIVAYLPADDKGRPAWVDRYGRKIADLPVPEGETVGVGLSRNGDVLLTRREDQSAAISLWVVRGANTQRIGAAPGGYMFPVWSNDGSHIYFGRGKGVYRRLPAQGAEEEPLLAAGAEDAVITTSTADGAYAYGMTYNPALKQGFDIFRLDLRSRTRQFWSATEANETMPQLSPDGLWMAWLCEYLDRGRLCLSPVHDSRKIWYATTTAAFEPAWSADGKRLYFISGGMLQSARVSFAGGLPSVESPESLFRLTKASVIGATYAPAPDGEKFLVRDVFRPAPDPVLIWNPALNGARP